MTNRKGTTLYYTNDSATFYTNQEQIPLKGTTIFKMNFSHTGFMSESIVHYYKRFITTRFLDLLKILLLYQT
jgi:hypothetical protein